MWNIDLIHIVHSRETRAISHIRLEVGQCTYGTVGHDFDASVGSIAYEPRESEGRRAPLGPPPEADTLHPASHDEPDRAGRWGPARHSCSPLPCPAARRCRST
jgi:hypothetical protein